MFLMMCSLFWWYADSVSSCAGACTISLNQHRDSAEALRRMYIEGYIRSSTAALRKLCSACT